MGKGYILCGDNASSGTNYQDMYEYDPAMNQWRRIDDFPGSARRYMACVTLNDITYCGLGTSGINYRDFWRFSAIADIEELDADITVTAFPNPAIEQITIETSFKEDFDLIITNGQGQFVSELRGNKQSAMIDRKNLDAGVYYYVIIVDNAAIKSGSFIFK